MSTENSSTYKVKTSRNQVNRYWYKVDPSLLSSKTVYYLLGAKTSCYEPFIVIFMMSIGLSSSKAGLVGGLRVVGALIGSPFWAFVADLKGIHKYICMVLCIGSLLFMLAQPFISLSIAEAIGNHCRSLSPSNDKSFNSSNITLQGQISTKSDENPRDKLFYTMLILNILAKFFDGAQAGFADNAVVAKCSAHPDKPDFGKQRLFGAFGFGTGVLLTTFAVKYFPNANISCYMGMFTVFSILTFMFMGVFWMLNKDITLEAKTKENNNDINSRENISQVKLLLKTLIKFDTILFFSTVLVMGLMQSIYLSYTVLFLKDIGADPVVNGVSIAVAAISCVFTFFWGSVIIKYLKGTFVTIAFCCGSYFVRYIAVGYLTEPWLMPLIQSLQSIGFGLFLVVSILHIKDISPVEIRTTMYGIFNAIFYGASFVIGNIVGGYIYAQYKAKYLFLWAAYFALAWTVLITAYIFIKMFFIGKKAPTKDEKELEELAKLS